MIRGYQSSVGAGVAMEMSRLEGVSLNLIQDYVLEWSKICLSWVLLTSA